MEKMKVILIREAAQTRGLGSPLGTKYCSFVGVTELPSARASAYAFTCSFNMQLESLRVGAKDSFVCVSDTHKQCV